MRAAVSALCFLASAWLLIAAAAAAEAGAAPAPAPAALTADPPLGLRALNGSIQQAAAFTRIAELYLPRFQGYDWSLAGYKDGAAALPRGPNKYNVKAGFGAKGDGRTDDTRALTAAVAAANAGGGVVYFPPGSYVLTKPLVIDRSGVVLRGAATSSTKILITRSLSEVTGIRWVPAGRGKLKSPWAHGGAFITFKGANPQKSNNEKTFITTVTGDVYPGARRIPVPPFDGFKFKVGQFVRIFLNDRSTPARGTGAQSAAVLPSVGITQHGNVSLVVRPPPSWLASSVAYQSALEKMQADPENEPGLSVQQAAAAQAAFARQAAGAGGGGGGSSGVQAAAPTASVVAWIYGENQADSGKPGEQIVEHDTVSVGARVVAISRNHLWIDRDLPFPILPRLRGWKGSIHLDKPATEGVGLERLTIEFKHSIVGPHFSDVGYNGVEFWHVGSSWVSQVTFLNADNALWFSWVHRSTMKDVTVDVTRSRVNPALGKPDNGHQGIVLAKGSSNLITGFNIAARMIHDVVIQGTYLNVLERGRGVDVNLDHHRNAPWANLFTDIDVGLGSRAFFSGGLEGRGANTGRGTTFWNVHAANTRQPLQLPPCSPDYGAMVNFVGRFQGDSCARLRWYVHGMGLPVARWPANMYRAQILARRRMGNKA